jgi:TonB-linked SusC/RagA family outer membrane protein
MKKLSLVLMLVLLVVGFAAAQRTLSGTVSDENGEPLIGATILLKGTSRGTVTDVDGNYTIEVPEDGQQVLIVSYTGYTTEEIEVGVSDEVDIQLVSAIEELTEVVVTGLGIEKEKKALGYGVTTISSREITTRSEADVGRLLRGKATGVDITQTSGIAGSGTNIIIRGYSSITGSNQPLFVVDGVPFNTDTNTDRGFTTGSATASSRFLDLDPNNIAEISILKGLSATVLYGEAGRNGVILVTTKTGQASGTADKKFEVSFNQSVFGTEIANLSDYQNSFGNGFSGNYGPFFSNWGPSFDVAGSNGIAEDGTIPHPLNQSQYADDFPEFQGVRVPWQPANSPEKFFSRTGLGLNTSVNVDKSLGTEGAISATFSHYQEEGFTPELFAGDPFPSNLFEDESTMLARNNFSLGGRYQLLNGLTVSGSFNYTDTRRVNPPASTGYGSNPAGASLFANIVYTPRDVDIFSFPYQSPLDGSMAYYRRGSAIQNPLWTLHNARDEERVRRFFGAFDLSYDINDWLSATYRIGIDQYTQNNARLINRGGSQVPDGEMTVSDRLNRITDQVLNLVYNFQLSDAFTLDGILGVNFRREENERNRTFSTNQFLFDLFNSSNFIDHTADSRILEENNIGAYLTATLSYKNFLYLNFQGRNDWTSTLEPDNNSIFYPSGSISFIPTEAIPSLQSSTLINYLKFRIGYGTSAGYPNPYQTRSTLGTNTNVYVTSGGQVLNTNTVSNRLGNPNLLRELHQELEGGVEARLLNNRLGIDLSLYDKGSDDLIIDLELDPSTGYTNTTVNAAEVTNKGIELGLNLIPVKTRDWTWDITFNYTKNENEVVRVAEGVDQVLISGFTNLGNFAEPGQPYGVMKGLPFQRIDGEIVVGADGIPVPASDLDVIGDPNPNFNFSIINGISWKGLTLNAQFDYIDGGSIHSILAATMLARGNTVDTDVDRFIPLIYPGVSADGSPNDVQAYIGDVAFRAYFFADEGVIFDGTTWRMRELSLSYELPQGLLGNTPFGSASIRLWGENLWFKAFNFPEGVNYDPEVLSLGVGNGRGFEFVTGPTAKKYGVALNFTF